MDPKALLGIALLASACSSSLEPVPRDDVRLLVTNRSCDPGPCTPLRIFGFPNDQPHTPGGLWSIELGVVSGPTACFVLPASRAFTITEEPSGKQTIHRWTTADGLALGAQTLTDNRLLATPSTGEFVPASTLAWSVAFPGPSEALPASTCAP